MSEDFQYFCAECDCWLVYDNDKELDNGAFGCDDGLMRCNKCAKEYDIDAWEEWYRPLEVWEH